MCVCEKEKKREKEKKKNFKEEGDRRRAGG